MEGVGHGKQAADCPSAAIIAFAFAAPFSFKTSICVFKKSNDARIAFKSVCIAASAASSCVSSALNLAVKSLIVMPIAELLPPGC